MKNRLLFAISIFFLCSATGFAQDLAKTLAPLKYRNIGPFRGGRANAYRCCWRSVNLLYGNYRWGVWKTKDTDSTEKHSDGFFKMGSVVP